MRILVTNDDGIYAPGLWSLVRAVLPLGEVVVVAPDREQSGVGSSVTLHVPVRVKTITSPVEGVPTYSVEGTPADCVILALGAPLVEGGVDLVLAGINEGANLGNDILISGTVGAALQGHFYDLPAIALSVASLENLYFEVAASLGFFFASQVASGALPGDIFLNINVPNLPRAEIEGLELTTLGKRSYRDVINEGHDGKRKYYWIVRGKPEWDTSEKSDIWAVRHRRISITPLHTNLTTSSLFPQLQTLLQQLPRQGKAPSIKSSSEAHSKTSGQAPSSLP